MIPTKELTGIPLRVIAETMVPFETQLKGLLRYQRFMAGESPNEWARLLGPDVISATHPQVTADIAADMVEFNQSHGALTTTDDLILLLTAAHVHDWGELKIAGYGVGDVSFDQKTETDEAVEVTVFEQLLQTVPVDEARDLIRTAYQTVVLDHSTPLGRLFNTVERVGYMKTALRCYEGVGGGRIQNWRGLTGNVLSNQVEKLIAYAADNPYVANFLENNSTAIDSMLAATGQVLVPLDNEGNLSFDAGKLARAITAWAEYRDGQ